MTICACAVLVAVAQGESRTGGALFLTNEKVKAQAVADCNVHTYALNVTNGSLGKTYVGRSTLVTACATNFEFNLTEATTVEGNVTANLLLACDSTTVLRSVGTLATIRADLQRNGVLLNFAQAFAPSMTCSPNTRVLFELVIPNKASAFKVGDRIGLKVSVWALTGDETAGKNVHLLVGGPNASAIRAIGLPGAAPGDGPPVSGTSGASVGTSSAATSTNGGGPGSSSSASASGSATSSSKTSSPSASTRTTTVTSTATSVHTTTATATTTVTTGPAQGATTTVTVSATGPAVTASTSECPTSNSTAASTSSSDAASPTTSPDTNSTGCPTTTHASSGGTVSVHGNAGVPAAAPAPGGGGRSPSAGVVLGFTAVAAAATVLAARRRN